jgi:hypothetical protein
VPPQLGEREAALEGLRSVVALNPDDHQRDIEADVARGLGQTIPKLRLGQDAKRVISQLQHGPAAPR